MPARSTPATTVTAERLAELVGVTPSSVLRWAREGLIPSHRAGARIWFVLEEVNAATLQEATAREARPAVQLSPRLFEIVGQQARGDAARSRKKKTGRVRSSGRSQ